MNETPGGLGDPPELSNMAQDGQDPRDPSGPGKRRALGRGLSALLPGAGRSPAGAGTGPGAGAADAAAAGAAARNYLLSPVEEIHANPNQPRKRFPDGELNELAQSIRTHGVIQPLIVRARAGGGFILIAGERRWRAAQRAGLLE